MLRIICGDALEQLKTLPAESVQCCVTSPPYWGLRDYGVAGQMGLEKTPEEYVAKMVEVFAEVRRVLRGDGVCFVNLGDSYWGGGKYLGINSENTLAPKQASNRGARGVCQELGAAGKTTTWGLKPKELCGIPWRVAFALQADGWYLRSDIIWAKPNPMPESVTDRPTKAHEYIFLLSKGQRYYYDADAVKESAAQNRWGGHAPVDADNSKGDYRGLNRERDMMPEYRNRRTVWTVPTAPFKGAHFATFPPKLIEPCILAGSRLGDTILDPFGGSGTTGMVSIELGRKAILIELNPAYIELARKRCNTQPILKQKELITV